MALGGGLDGITHMSTKGEDGRVTCWPLFLFFSLRYLLFHLLHFLSFISFSSLLVNQKNSAAFSTGSSHTQIHVFRFRLAKGILPN